jgi:prevent-host-death family protein
MDISLAEAKTHLSDLIDQVSKGEEVTITKRGKPVARLTPVQPKRIRIDAKALRAHTSTMTFQTHSAGDFIRAMRDGDRY